jgi:hypothetical protein
VTAARIFIGRSRSGSLWHLVPKPGTAFPVSACGTWIDRRTMRASDSLPARRCTRCSKMEQGS